jgi:hypothetical protein
VTFTPAASGTRTAAVTLTDNATGSPQTVSLTGTGTAAVASLSPSSLTFASQAVGATSAAQTITLNNTGNAALTLTSIALTGTNPGDFAQTNNCGSSVAAGANCTISVTFTPAASGTRTAAVTLTDNATGSPQTVNLTGTGSGSSTFTLSGTVSPASSGGGTLLTLSGPSSATVTANSSGNYSFAGLANGTYTVTPSMAGFTFSPASQSVTINGANATAVNFTATAQTWSISGNISPASSGSGALVTLSGSSSATVTADSSGNYSFAGLANGTYTVTPSMAGITFSPASQSVTINGANATAVNFTAQVAGGAIHIDAQVFEDEARASTTVETPAFSTTAGNELLLAFVATDYLSGANTTVTSVSGGGLTWVLVVRTNKQSGTSEIWRAFAPSLLSNVKVTATLSQGVISSITVMSFTGVNTSGTNGSGAIGATGTGNANPGAPTATLVTTQNNSWVFGVGNDYDNAIARTPGTGQSLVHQYLTPTGDTDWVQMQNIPTPVSGTSVTINDTAPTTDRYNLSICEVLPASAGQTYSISGTLSPSPAGSGATVTLSGTSSNTVTADSSGNYSFAGLANGTYTVTPSNSGYNFSPASQTVTINGTNVTNVNFTGTAPSGQTFSISGTISPSTGGSGATLTLNGTASATTTASGSGAYSFSGLANGTYSITPSNAGFSFSPTTQAVTINGSNATGVNFVATPTYTISGTISPAASGAGATVTLSGAANTTTTASPSGAYSFSGLANGAYTVTPSNAGFSFSPTAQAVTINSNNATGVNFTATAIAQNGCGDTLTSASPTCQVIGSGTLNPAWTVISRHGEYAQDEDECNIPSSWTQTSGTLTTTTANTSYTCGDFFTNGTVRDTPASWPYTTGDIQWGSLSFKYGTITVRFKLPSSATDLWPAIWMLGTNCQTTNIYSGDTGFDGCPNLGSSGYQELDLVECDVDRWCGFTGYNPGSTCAGTFSITDTNYHVLVTTWTSSGISQTIDGNSIGTCSAGSFANPMFLILQTQAGGIGNPVNSQLPATFSFSYVQVKNSSGTIIFSDDFSTDTYFAQASAGTGMGSDCAEARAISSMLAMDWSPGNDLHLCGTYTTQPVALGSGTSGSPITVTYESGASGPCPNLNGYTYITVVGGSCSASSTVAPSATFMTFWGESPEVKSFRSLAARLANK